MTDAAPVLVRREGGLGRLSLDRPEALHALTTPMCRTLTQALLAWRDDPGIEAVLLDHASGRGFCAGGDIRMLAESGAGDGAQAHAFFLTEYRLNALLHRYPKPVVAVMDGITMGGGVGLSMPCRFRVSTERTTFAMPETGIGLFPDVGGGWFLPRMPGATGMWLALTGARLKAADCLLTGVATDHVESGRLEALKRELARRPGAIEAVLTEFEGDPGPAPLSQVRDDIDRLFSGATLQAVLDGLAADDGAWAREQGHGLSTKSPTSLAVTFRQLREGGAHPDFEANMAMEMRLAVRSVASHDFQEGVRALIVEKDNAPRWRPATVAEVPSASIDAAFAPLPPDQEWTPLE